MNGGSWPEGFQLKIIEQSNDKEAGSMYVTIQLFVYLSKFRANGDLKKTSFHNLILCQAWEKNANLSYLNIFAFNFRSKASILDLFKTRNMLKKTVIQMYVWFTTSFVYYGLTLNSDTLIPGNLYVNYAVGGLAEFPALVLTTLLLHFIGRRYPQSACYFLGGLALLLNLASPSGLSL